MQHLNRETLARLIDEAPDAAEARHLEACAACDGELDALRAQTDGLHGLPDLPPPADGWSAVEARLAEEGLIHGKTPVHPLPAATPASWGRGGWTRHLPRLAAGLALFLAGGVAGAAATGGGSVTDAPFAVNGAGTEAPPVGTVDDAVAALRDAEAVYLAALDRYAELSGTAQPTDAAARLAALEGIVLTTRAALDEAPADPVINTYHLTATGQRDAMLRQIAGQSQDPWF